MTTLTAPGNLNGTLLARGEVLLRVRFKLLLLVCFLGAIQCVTLLSLPAMGISPFAEHNPSHAANIFISICILVALGIIAATAHKHPKRVPALGVWLSAVGFSVVMTLGYINGTIILAITSPWLLLFTIVALPVHYSFFGALVYIATVSVTPSLGAAAFHEPSVELRIALAMLAIVWPATYLANALKRDSGEQLTPHDWGFLKLGALQRLLFFGVFASSAYALLVEDLRANTPITIVVTALLWLWIVNARRVETRHQIVFLSLDITLWLTNVFLVDGFTIFSAAPFLFALFLVLPRPFAVGVALLEICIGFFALDLLDGLVIRGVAGAITCIAALSIWFKTCEDTRANDTSRNDPSTKKLRWMISLASGALAYSLLELPEWKGAAVYVSGEEALRTHIFIYVLSGLTVWVVYELQGYLNQRQRQLERLTHQLQTSLQQEAQANEVLQARSDELIAQKHRETQMYAVIGHELRTPAAALKMMLKNASEHGEPIDKRTVSSTVDQLLGVIDALRSVAQPERMAIASLENAALPDLLENQILTLRPIATQHGLSLESNLGALGGAILKVPVQLIRQIVSNLIKNALVHSGGTKVTLSASSALNGSNRYTITLVVEDDGHGIDSESVERLFDAFERGDTEAEGTGLGLHISREIAHTMDGDLRYEPNPTGGSRFILEWTASAPEAPKVEQASVAEVSNQILQNKRILLAEDNKMLQTLTKRMLESRGAKVDVAKDGKAALTCFNERDYDLILSDIFMPNMNGYEFVSAIRSQGSTLPVIGLTAATIGEETEKMLDSGADAVLSKPADAEELVAVYQSITSRDGASGSGKSQ